MARALALFLALVCALPSAAAFASTPRDLVISYDAAATPVVLGAGGMGLAGAVDGGFLLGGATTTVLEGIDSLVVATPDGPREVRDATLEVSRGALLWRFTSGALQIDVRAPYALGLALPRAPIPSEDGRARAGFLLAGEALSGHASWSGGRVELVPLDAIVTIRDADGQPVDEWEAREVNERIRGADQAVGQEAFFAVEGAFTARLGAEVVAGGAGRDAALAFSVAPAEEDRFVDTVALLGRTAASLTEGSSSLAGTGGPLAVLGRVSGILNGALVIVPGDGTTPEAVPRSARWGEADFDLGAFNVMRGDDMEVAWREGELRVQGEPQVALGREGFAVEPPARVGIFPILSLLLWALAIGGVALWTVRRPPLGVPDRTARLVSLGIHVAALLGAFWLWDKSFADTFGTSALSVLGAHGISPATIPQIATLALIELVPWGIAALLFALPVRIAAGIGLRYLGRGKSYKGVASAAGLLSLAAFGPLYALWCFNLVWAQAGRLIAG